MSRVVVVGSINIDLVIEVPRLPSPGETILGDRFTRHFGGKGANQAVAAARAGATVVMIGAVGSDEHGDASLSALSAEGIDISAVQRTNAATGVALIAVAPGGENQIVVAPGANSLVTWETAGALRLDAEDVLLISLEIPMSVVEDAVAAARAADARVVLNPAPAQPLPAALLALNPILTPNERELLTLTGAETPEAALVSLGDLNLSTVIVTRGAAGALIVRGGHRQQIAGIPVRAVDATGAGDTFSGVLAAWLAAGATELGASEAANAAAALSVTRFGARAGMPQQSEILAEIAATIRS